MSLLLAFKLAFDLFKKNVNDTYKNVNEKLSLN